MKSWAFVPISLLAAMKEVAGAFGDLNMAGSTAVLLIDDSDDDTLLLRRAMTNCCPSVSDVLSVSDVEAAQRYLSGVGEYEDRSKYPMPRLIFLDLNLRQSKGAVFLEWAKRHPRFKTIPIVAITGDISGRQATATLAQGASAVMLKGANFDEWKNGLLHATELWLRHCIGPELSTPGEVT